MNLTPRLSDAAAQKSAEDPARSRIAASGRAGLFALLVLFVGWKCYSLATGNFRIQETWSAWQYAQTFPQDLFLFTLLFVVWDLLLKRLGRGGLACLIVICFFLVLFQCVDSRMKVRFLHPLTWQWVRYAIDEARTLGPDYMVFTGGSYWMLALASLGALLIAFFSPWIVLLRALAAGLGVLERGLRLPIIARVLLVPLCVAVFLTPAQPYGLQRNFVLASLLAIDKQVVGYDHYETRASEEPVQRSSPACLPTAGGTWCPTRPKRRLTRREPFHVH